MRVPSYCFMSKGIKPVYYFRMRVPKELQPFLNKPEIKKSLRTSDQATAYNLCREYASATEKHFAELRLKLFQASLIDDNKPDTLEHLGLAPAPAITQTVSTPPRVESNESTLSKLIDLYITDVTSNQGSDVSFAIEKNLHRFMEVVTDKPVSHYTVEDRQKFREVLQKIPKRVNGPRFRDISIATLLERERPPEQRLSVTSVNHRLIEVATFLNWCIKNSLIQSHPFKNAVIKKRSTSDKDRPALSDSEIKTIIANLPADQVSLSYCILISIFGGLRQSEVAGLDANDIIKSQDGNWCIDINDRGDKKLKSKNGQRIIPIHPVLLKAGIVELAQRRTGGKLFPDIRPYKGKYGHQVSKDFAKYRRSLGINGAGQTFHGIRHSVISKLWSAGIPEAHTAAIAGHQRGERESYIRYAKKNDLRPLVTAIKTINYGRVKLPAWMTEK